MGMKDQQRQGQNQGRPMGKDKPGQARERAGQRGQQGQQPDRGRQNIDDTEMQDRMDHDYDA
ncbi:hypothetical protein [Streptomyces sp. AM6-12]|uniref:hypothetical protein n=1 Tax=Streptomyces sp. AM6-12 TaxID=3345149 RepID=UPI0037AB1985